MRLSSPLGSATLQSLELVYFLIYYYLLPFQVYRRHSINACCVYEGRTTQVKEGRSEWAGADDGAAPEQAVGEAGTEFKSAHRELRTPWKGDASRSQDSGEPTAAFSLRGTGQPQRCFRSGSPAARAAGTGWGSEEPAPGLRAAEGRCRHHLPAAFQSCSCFCKWKCSLSQMRGVPCSRV